MSLTVVGLGSAQVEQELDTPYMRRDKPLNMVSIISAYFFTDVILIVFSVRTHHINK
jgi:hypothetical protein